jgi:hypothetical protein
MAQVENFLWVSDNAVALGFMLAFLFQKKQQPY